jgi:hypothetical protein
MRSRILYIENKSEQLNNRGRIGRATYSKTGKTIYYRGLAFQSLKGGYKANYVEVESGDLYWISGPKKFGGDRLYGTPGTEIDEDVREEYWTTIRRQPERAREATA